MIYEQAPAKINLTLDTLYRRDDGFHEVEMIMTSVDLIDRLSFELLQDDTIKLHCDSANIPIDQRNLVYQAADLLKRTFHVKQGVSIHLQKKIPIAAGLAGGSADCAATFRGLNRLWQLNLSLDELADLASQLGSDIAYCIYNKTALCQGRGEKLTFLPSLPNAWCILAKPSISVSTADVYGALDCHQVLHPNTQQALQAIKTNNYALLCQSLGNSLEDVTLKKYPQVLKLKEIMQKAGADAVLMSGSGPTVFALVTHENQVRRIYNALRGCCEEVYAVRLLT